MITKLDNRDIKMLESSAKSETSKVALQEYLSAHGKAEVAWKVFRDSLSLSEDDVSKVNVKSERKFKAGDKVRVLDTSFLVATSNFDVGDVTEVIGYKSDFEEYAILDQKERPVVVLDSDDDDGAGFFDESALELVTEEEKSPNELRAEVIKDAMEFIKKNEGENKIILVEDNYFVVKTIFIEDAEKKTVVVLLKDSVTSRIRTKGIAKCHPDDVFNANIGKAIALGRALGKDVSEFENAVQPTEPVVGHVVKGNEVSGFYRQDRKFTLTTNQGDTFYYAETKEYEPNESDDFIFDDQIGVIIDDTNAQY